MHICLSCVLYAHGPREKSMSVLSSAGHVKPCCSTSVQTPRHTYGPPSFIYRAEVSHSPDLSRLTPFSDLNTSRITTCSNPTRFSVYPYATQIPPYTMDRSLEEIINERPVRTTTKPSHEHILTTSTAGRRQPIERRTSPR